MLLSLLLLLCHLPSPSSAYRRTDDTTTAHTPFVPYERGFVGVTGLPDNFGRERVNEGAPGTQDYPRNYVEDEDLRGASAGHQTCPGMIGPLKDKKVRGLSNIES